MFVRFRVSPNKKWLRLTLVAGCWVGAARQRHIASLGSVRLPATVARRAVYYSQLPLRLTQLIERRVDAETIGKVLAAVEARVPRPTCDEQFGILGRDYFYRPVADSGWPMLSHAT